jgi:hypothetical protein
VAQPGVRGIYSETKYQQAKENISIVQETTPELGKRMKFVTDKQELAIYHHPKALAAVVTDVAARVWPYKLVAHLLQDLLVSSSEDKLLGKFNLQTLTPALPSAQPPNQVHPSFNTATKHLPQTILLVQSPSTSNLFFRCQLAKLPPLPT